MKRLYCAPSGRKSGDPTSLLRVNYGTACGELPLAWLWRRTSLNAETEMRYTMTHGKHMLYCALLAAVAIVLIGVAPAPLHSSPRSAARS
jgi:hypothetical protein